MNLASLHLIRLDAAATGFRRVLCRLYLSLLASASKNRLLKPPSRSFIEPIFILYIRIIRQLSIGI